jgi:hypothetical protein
VSAQHTPGPLTIGTNTSSKIAVLAPRRILDPNFTLGSGDAMDAVAVFYGPSETRKANATLFKASTDLLVALTNLVAECESMGRASHTAARIAAAHDAIEKATVRA